jgi:hypothetical protein
MFIRGRRDCRGCTGHNREGPFEAADLETLGTGGIDASYGIIVGGLLKKELEKQGGA